MTIDLRKYAGEGYLTAADAREGPLQRTIAAVRYGQKYDKPELVLETGEILSLNATNTRALMRTYGASSDSLIGKAIELRVEPVMYKGALQDSIVVKPLSPPLTASERDTAAGELPAPRNAMDDDIPF